MALTTWYSAGTVSVDNGSAIVTGTGTLWGDDVIMPGDLFCDPAQPAVPPQRVKEVTADGTLELWAPWPGTTLTDAAYEIRYVGIIERSTAQTRKVLEQLGEVDAYFDLQVDELADRAAYDDQPAGYRVLVSNTGDGRSAIYSKNSATSADWSDPAFVTGGSIDVTVGTVSELVFGATPTVEGTPGAGSLELDFGLPGGPALSVGTITRGDAAVTSSPVTGGYELSFVIPSQVAQGDYAGGAAYVAGDVVQYAGSSWTALQATTGNAPPTLPTTNNAFWQLQAQKGNDGAGTVTSLSGGAGIQIDSADPTIPVISAIIASQAEAEAGTEVAKLMTPERVAQAIVALSDSWFVQPVGVPIPLQSDLTGVAEPPTDNALYRYIKLTASDAYNGGVLTSESISGSAPLVQATAVIDDAESPLNGQTVRLINTERRVLRAGSAGTVQNDAMQQITGTLSRVGSNRILFNGGSGAFSMPSGSESFIDVGSGSTGPYNGNVSFDSADSANARTGDETRSKNIGVDYYMRIR